MNQRKLAQTRRSFLRAVGAGAVALPFFKLLEGSVVRAQGLDLPLKFVGVYHPHGIAAEFWAMREGESEQNFDLTYADCSLQPFDDPATYGRSFKDRILIIEGIDHLSGANGHDSAGTILTGSRIDGSKQTGSSSLDQYLAIEQGLGADTTLSSLALGVGTDSTESGHTLSFGPGGVGLPKIIDPEQTFDLIFSNLVIGDDPAAQAEAQRKRRVGQSIIDFLRGEINSLKPKLGPAEQQKLDQHLTGIREIEKRLSAISGGGGGGGGGGCVAPPRPSPNPWTVQESWGEVKKLKYFNGGEPFFDAITDAQIDMLAAALACDITRFATLFMADLSYDGNPLGLPADNHGAVAHTYDASTVGRDFQEAAGTPSTWLPLAQINRYSYSKVARLMQKLDELGALDATLIYAASDMGNPAMHSCRNVPTVLAGGAGGKFRMGRRLRMGPDCSNGPWCGETDPSYTGVPNSRILVSIAQAFGAEIDQFGTQPDPKFSSGTLDGLV